MIRIYLHGAIAIIQAQKTWIQITKSVLHFFQCTDASSSIPVLAAHHWHNMILRAGKPQQNKLQQKSAELCLLFYNSLINKIFF